MKSIAGSRAAWRVPECPDRRLDGVGMESVGRRQSAPWRDVGRKPLPQLFVPPMRFCSPDGRTTNADRSWDWSPRQFQIHEPMLGQPERAEPESNSSQTAARLRFSFHRV